jgi:hypothetical protein
VPNNSRPAAKPGYVTGPRWCDFPGKGRLFACVDVT